jgi:hypothetical protein
MFSKWIKEPLSRNNGPERVHTDFLRQLSGMPKFVHKASLYKEMGREPLMLQWLVLAARLWNNMCDKDQGAILHSAFKDNVVLMLNKSRDCWSYHFLKAMHTIGILQRQVWNGDLATANAIMELRFREEQVKEAATAFFDKQWNLCKDESDPRSAPSTTVTCSTYLQWVGMPNHKGGARHMGCFMPRHLRREMMALKLGCHQLNIQLLRMQKNKKPRHERVCPLCKEPGVAEDILHFMLECGYYAPIRSKHGNIFGVLQARGVANAELLRSIFDHEHQMDLGLLHPRDVVVAGKQVGRVM